jgi:hypothetical protein
VLTAREDALVLGQIIEGGGAAEAGLAVGDGILRIDGVPVVEMGFPGAINRIRGPENSRVVLSIRRGTGGGCWHGARGGHPRHAQAPAAVGTRSLRFRPPRGPCVSSHRPNCGSRTSRCESRTA